MAKKRAQDCTNHRCRNRTRHGWAWGRRFFCSLECLRSYR